MRNQTLGEYEAEQSAKKREEYINSIDYNDTGGLPANLRYPYAMIDSGMDFLKIQIATYTAPDLNLSGLLDVNNEDKSDASGNSADIKLGRGASKPGAFALQNATSANSNNTGSGRALKKPKHTLYLPIPRQIQDANSVQYDSGRIDPLEAVGAALIKQGIENPSFETVSRTFDLLVNDGVDLIGMNTDAIASAIAGRAIGALGGNVTAIADAIASVFIPIRSTPSLTSKSNVLLTVSKEGFSIPCLMSAAPTASSGSILPLSY
jgi:hypothetical protein